MSFEPRSNIKSRAQSASIDSFSSIIASAYDPTTYEDNDEITTNSEMIFDALKSPSSKHVTFKSPPVPNAFAGLTTVSKNEQTGTTSITTGKSAANKSTTSKSNSKKPTKRASSKKDNSSKSTTSSNRTKPSHHDDDDPPSSSSSSVSSDPTFSKKKHKRKRKKKHKQKNADSSSSSTSDNSNTNDSKNYEKQYKNKILMQTSKGLVQEILKTAINSLTFTFAGETKLSDPIQIA